MKEINYIYIGTDKSGLTWLYNIFKQHPEIYVPTAKDVYFFDKYYHKGFNWYESFFKDSHNFKIAGEISHDYMFSIEEMYRIKNDLPIEKIWSQYLFLIRSGITKEPFEKAIESVDELIDKCLYGKYLSQYINMFNDEQLKIFYFDDLKKEPKEFANKVFDYLGVSMIDEINYYEKSLPANKLRLFFMAKLAKKSAIVLRELGFVNLLGRIKLNYLIQGMLYIPYDKNSKSKMTKEQFILFILFLKKILNYFKKLLVKTLNIG